MGSLIPWALAVVISAASWLAGDTSGADTYGAAALIMWMLHALDKGSSK